MEIFMKYFAYGSNMCTNWLRSRVPSASFNSIGILNGYILKFHKRSKDGSGKCNAYFTNKDSDRVIGAVFELDEKEKPALDRAEGLDNGYHEVELPIVTASGSVSAKMYVADDDAIVDSLSPYTWYKDLVINGARANGLPEAYIRFIDEIREARADPDQDREARNRRYLPCSNDGD
jgi:AIG2 family protein